MNPYYTEYSDFLARYFSGKVQKISVNAGLSCPNRDGRIGTGGCAYCNVASFTPAYALSNEPVSAQIARGAAFFGRKYKEMKYLAYFQAYTNTNEEIPYLMDLYAEAIAHPDVVGLVIGTRPDCMPRALLEELSRLDTKVMIEYGVETSHDSTLKTIGRGHTWADVEDAVLRTADAGLPVGVHLIAGLPGETVDHVRQTIGAINTLPVDVLKIHQLQIIRGTRFAAEWQADPSRFHIFSLEEYLDLCQQIIGWLRPGIAIDRFVSSAPASLLLAPKWGIKNYQFTNLLLNRLCKTHRKHSS